MSYFFSKSGLQALRKTVGPDTKLLLALDFDGTLAPIVPSPETAHASLPVARLLAEIGKLVDVAIVSGRAVDDVSSRLGFTPRFVVGNHGMEGVPDCVDDDALDVVAQWRTALHEKALAELAHAGVQLEDKGHSLSFHYRRADDRELALAAIDRALQTLQPAPARLAGKCVVNALPPNAPNKFDAICRLVQHISSDTVIFAGDDVTDDVVFENAPPHWLTIRVDANGNRQSARFHLAQTEIVGFLQHMLESLQSRTHASVRMD